MSAVSSLNLAILSRNPKAYSTRRLREAALARGHRCRVMDTLKFGIYVEQTKPALTYKGEPIDDYDAIIPRIGASISFYGAAVVRQFEQMGVFSANSAVAISTARDKLRSLQVLSRHDIGIAHSAFVRQKSDVLPAIQRLGGAPVIVKLLEGTQGIGVILAETEKVAEAIIETLQAKELNVLIQKFVSESKGRDIRAFVVGDRVVAAMRRRAVGGEFRSNVHRGGITERVQLTEEYERTAVRAAQIMGLRVAGVDMLEGNEGPVIMEVNSSPGLEGIEKCTGIDIAGEIIDYTAEHARFDDLDVRQRLSFARGYLVAEFTVTENWHLVGKTLAESGLRERDIVVMSINRGGQHYPVPRGSDLLHPGDVLLCYGPKLALREYLPTLERKRSKRSNGEPSAKKES
ncbi:MAG: 30S ribosomal protein S6--L-glutamate ligase [Verrucomicrobiota bacterium JB022]|nr:30S ribosomal protein S6--L-glutamate ligase [Verrucomicrobiota bacterium JB022]